MVAMRALPPPFDSFGVLGEDEDGVAVLFVVLVVVAGCGDDHGLDGMRDEEEIQSKGKS